MLEALFLDLALRGGPSAVPGAIRPLASIGSSKSGANFGRLSPSS